MLLRGVSLLVRMYGINVPSPEVLLQYSLDSAALEGRLQESINAQIENRR